MHNDHRHLRIVQTTTEGGVEYAAQTKARWWSMWKYVDCDGFYWDDPCTIIHKCFHPERAFVVNRGKELLSRTTGNDERPKKAKEFLRKAKVVP